MQVWIDDLGRCVGFQDREHLRSALFAVERAGQLHLGESSRPKLTNSGRSGLLHKGVTVFEAQRCSGTELGCALVRRHRAVPECLAAPGLAAGYGGQALPAAHTALERG